MKTFYKVQEMYFENRNNAEKFMNRFSKHGEIKEVVLTFHHEQASEVTSVKIVAILKIMQVNSEKA